ncbi:MAG: hypothetical protein WD768_20505 [Phycisphaeraceae bacterium]
MNELPFESDQQRDTFLAKLRTSGYRGVPVPVIERLLNQIDAKCIEAGAKAAVNNPQPHFSKLIVETFWARRQMERHQATPDEGLSFLVAALLAMKELNKQAEAIFLEAANDSDSTPMLAITGLHALVQMEHPDAEPIARRLLEDPREGVRAHAAAVWPRLNPEAYNALLATLKKPLIDTPTAGKVLVGLLQSQRPGAMDHVVRWLSGRDATTLGRCCADLSIYRPPGASQAMIRVLDGATKQEARQTLMQMLYRVGDAAASAKLIAIVETGSDAEARYIVEEMSGYEKTPGWNDQLRAAVRHRGDESLLPIIDQAVRDAANWRDR